MKTDGIQSRESLFKEIYNASFPKLYKIFFQSLKSEELTNDVLQETYLKLWDKLDELDGRQDYMPFLFFYARNFARKEVVLKLSTLELGTTVLPASYNVDMENELDVKEFRSVVKRVIESLPPKRKMIYRMFKEDGLSYKHIADTLNISSKTVDNHLSQAYKAVKRGLSSNYELRNTSYIFLLSLLSLLNAG
ncbi:sigma-70 family RNA polymerase sigma factor [Mucilaginibacter sp. Bleaf8]|uniref:RNA polymerase sigma factor n=1 Tax=Mucilaginibacter sp. Bleaf8 TaxID=2834430 RepID=UPI001BCD02CE|nr:sigma-70 family RNA polymerase sigma factor [Mucilaginibacter sp. Bleaf8]MBS7566956.1 sigma-70 family RNA polymerase sigma factor [Mucilaginibacter sp. Bleaf8]